MRIIDYYMSSDRDKETWLDSFSITSGLRYFGGKSVIGKYLMNRICNMACRMTENGKKPHIFIDAFAGGGKIALSIPEGWFDMIVLNDLNYGVYSFFKSCKEKPLALVKLIEEIGKVYNEDLFRYFTLNRAHGHQKKSKRQSIIDKFNKIKMLGLSDDDEETKKKSGIEHYDFYKEHIKYMYEEPVDELVAAAMTYFVTQTSWNGDTEPATITYRFSVADNKEGNLSALNEKEKIERMVNRAKRHVFHVHNLMIKKNIVVENLDYRELIKKYNGKEFSDLNGSVNKDESYINKNILWYFDPPYHPATLAGGKPAAYEDTFPIKVTREMTEILHNDHIETYGELFYFIKSDYCPKDCYDDIEAELQIAKMKYAEKQRKGTATNSDLTIVNNLQEKVDKIKEYYHDFDCLETGEYYREEIGTFSKGGEGTENNKTKGTEFVWCRG